MEKALVIYGSTTGNTEAMAESIEEALGQYDVEAEIKNVVDASAKDLTAQHDLLVSGCPACGDDQIELQDDFDE